MPLQRPGGQVYHVGSAYREARLDRFHRDPRGHEPASAAGRREPVRLEHALREAAEWSGAGWIAARASSLGAVLSSAEAARWAEEAHRHPPVLRTHDRYGNRVDEVDFHPSWHNFMRLAVENGAHALPWAEPRPGAHAARAVMLSMLSQTEPGHCCPVSMTYAAVPALRASPELAAEWEPRITAPVYDPGLRPPDAKSGVLVGMAMTEKQGGSDVRANTTTATPTGRGLMRCADTSGSARRR
ncbi:hypothetical protein GCM10029992_48550 [Glycomyces albus]